MTPTTPRTLTLTTTLLTTLLLITLTTNATANNPNLPPGGNHLLANVLDVCTTCDPLPELATHDRTPNEWEQYFRDQEHQDQNDTPEDDGALANLSDQHIATLTSYLAINLPLPDDRIHDDITTQHLPPDGPELMQRYCAVCHSLAVAVIPEWEIEQLWQDLLTDPHHIGTGLSDQRLEEIAAYLANNPMQPDDLR